MKTARRLASQIIVSKLQVLFSHLWALLEKKTNINMIDIILKLREINVPM